MALHDDDVILGITVALLYSVQAELAVPSIVISEVIEKIEDVRRRERRNSRHQGCPVCGQRTEDD